MHATSGSVVKNFLVNPLVWIAWILSGFTLHYEGYSLDVFQLFYDWHTYLKLVIGVIIYVCLFDRKYKKNTRKIDVLENLKAIFDETIYILVVWLITLSLIINYFVGGEKYKETLTQKYIDSGWIQQEKSVSAEDIREAISRVDFKVGVTYVITPKEDGSLYIDILE